MTDSLVRLRALAASPPSIRGLFAADPGRAAAHTLAACGIRLDLSKTSIDAEVLAALTALAEARGLAGFLRDLFGGAPVNATEGRSVLHMALRGPRDAGYRAGEEDATAAVHATLDRMAAFVADVHAGRVRGATGRGFDTVLNIGIGGSDLGPRMVAEALTMLDGGRMAARFLSNVDGHAFAALSRTLDPARTLAIVASKTFTTQETMANAGAARDWLAAALGRDAAGAHFAAVSTNGAACAEFGIPPDRVFGFRDWVGGRFSLWSSVGLAVALAAGWDRFAALLAGGHAMDMHVRDSPFATNLAVRLGFVGVWHALQNFPARAVLAYDQRLSLLAAFLQQLEMESNGKSVRLDGAPVEAVTCPVVFGVPGTDAQHSFMQLVHQGKAVVPVDFILARHPDHDRPVAHAMLAANAFAQAEALLAGKSVAEAEAENLKAGMDPARAKALAPHRAFSGERPSVFLLLDRLTPETLGALIALYEHKVAVEGRIWGINSFDQWGVELGKVLAAGILPELSGGGAKEHDSSTAALIAAFKVG